MYVWRAAGVCGVASAPDARLLTWRRRVPRGDPTQPPTNGDPVIGPVFDLRLAVLYRREFGWRWVLSYGTVVVPVALVAVTICATVGLT